MIQQGETISAIATATGAGGIGIIRLSGEKALEVAAKIFRSKSGKSITAAKSYQAMYGSLVKENGELIDEAICLVMKSPHSYTMEDVVELQCHGGAMPLKETLELTYRYGARPAERGEFTKRAFLNGRLDLSQAQAVMDVIEAKTSDSLRLAAGHLSGAFSAKMSAVRHEILGMIAHLEAAIDFPEDDIDDASLADVAAQVKVLREDLQKMLATAQTGRILREGLMTAIIGKPNVGKSSLLNALLREQRAIVTDIPGTTRDSIEEYANIGGVPLRIIDTAGIRSTEDIVEKMGVEKAVAYVKQAELVLALFDASRELTAEDERIIQLIGASEAIILLNKTDLAVKITKEMMEEKLPGKTILDISAARQQGLEELAEVIAKKVYGNALREEAPSFVNDARQAEILRRTDEHLAEAEKTISYGMSPDFVVIDLRAAWEKLGEITGETVGEDIIDEIFSRFCIGK